MKLQIHRGEENNKKGGRGTGNGYTDSGSVDVCIVPVLRDLYAYTHVHHRLLYITIQDYSKM